MYHLLNQLEAVLSKLLTILNWAFLGAVMDRNVIL
jgi:hypothetical protein